MRGEPWASAKAWAFDLSRDAMAARAQPSTRVIAVANLLAIFPGPIMPHLN